MKHFMRKYFKEGSYHRVCRLFKHWTKINEVVLLNSKLFTKIYQEYGINGDESGYRHLGPL